MILFTSNFAFVKVKETVFDMEKILSTKFKSSTLGIFAIRIRYR